jgi:hypothetical protein
MLRGREHVLRIRIPSAPLRPLPFGSEATISCACAATSLPQWPAAERFISKPCEARAVCVGWLIRCGYALHPNLRRRRWAILFTLWCSDSEGQAIAYGMFCGEASRSWWLLRQNEGKIERGYPSPGPYWYSIYITQQRFFENKFGLAKKGKTIETVKGLVRRAG